MGGPAAGEGMFRDPVEIDGGHTEPVGSIQTPADTVVGVGATVPLPAPPADTIRMRVQVKGGDTDTQIIVREVGGIAGSGPVLVNLGSTMYGGGGEGAIAPLEVESVAGPAVVVAIQFEVDA